MSKLPILLVGSLSLIAGCDSWSAPRTARDTFAESNFCPTDRVTVTPLAPAQTPAADIAADPERLKMWRQSQAGWQYFEVDGCGLTQHYECRHGTLAEAKGIQEFVCDAEDSAVSKELVARLSSPEVVRLVERYPLAQAPSGLPPWKVLLKERVVGTPPPSLTAAQLRGDCAEEASRRIGLVGWAPVSNPNDPYDRVLQFDCYASSSMATWNGAMYLLLPANRSGYRLETPNGGLVAQFHELPATFVCPVADATKCKQAFHEYAAALFVRQVAESNFVDH